MQPTDQRVDDSSSLDSDEEACRDLESAHRQLRKIDKKIRSKGVTKKERRLLQNRKSALKCRLKKDQEMMKVRKQLEGLTQENE